jgi:hypothetical protein
VSAFVLLLAYFKSLSIADPSEHYLPSLQPLALGKLCCLNRIEMASAESRFRENLKTRVNLNDHKRCTIPVPFGRPTHFCIALQTLHETLIFDRISKKLAAQMVDAIYRHRQKNEHQRYRGCHLVTSGSAMAAAARCSPKAPQQQAERLQFWGSSWASRARSHLIFGSLRIRPPLTVIGDDAQLPKGVMDHLVDVAKPSGSCHWYSKLISYRSEKDIAIFRGGSTPNPASAGS